MLWFLVDSRFLQVLQGGIRVVLPQLLQLVDLRGRDLPGSSLLLLRGNLHQPVQEASVIDQGAPVVRVPVGSGVHLLTINKAELLHLISFSILTIFKLTFNS